MVRLDFLSSYTCLCRSTTNSVTACVLYYITTAISHAMARDGSSGGVIRLVVIDKTGVEKEVVLGEHAY